jgi:hypothetical protein
MTTRTHQARKNMRRDIYAAIRRNLFHYDAALSRHQVVEILADVLAGQIDIIRDNARRQRTE